MEKYHLALDSGGSKVLGILYNEDFQPIRTVRTGSLRPNTTPEDRIRRNIADIISGLELPGLTIGRVSGIVDCGLLHEEIAKVCTVEETRGCGEFAAGMWAAEIFGDGILALAGTGATLFARYNGHSCGTGGYGAAVSDEGSGYWVAREAFNAAILDDQERGPRTLLTDMISEHFGMDRENFHDAVFRVYSQERLSPVACVASCAPLVSRAAEAGDEIAMRILENAGRGLAEQVLYLVRKNDLPHDLPVTISGSVWRSHRILFDTFRGILKDGGMTSTVKIPAFEPIVGVIIGHWHDLHGTFGEKEKEDFTRRCAEYRFAIQQEQKESFPC